MWEKYIFFFTAAAVKSFMLKMNFSLMIHLMSPIEFFVKLQGHGSLSLIHTQWEKKSLLNAIWMSVILLFWNLKNYKWIKEVMFSWYLPLNISWYSFLSLTFLVDTFVNLISDIFSSFIHHLITVNHTGLLWNKCRMKKTSAQWLGNTTRDVTARKHGALKSIVNASKLTYCALRTANVWTARILRDLRSTWLFYMATILIPIPASNRPMLVYLVLLTH